MTDRQFEHFIMLIQHGERQGLKDIYDEYGKTVYSIIFSVVRNPQDAEDITSDFFVKLWSIADTYCYGGKHKRWLAAIARNMAVDFMRKNSKEQLIIDIDRDETIDEGHSKIEPVDTADTENTVVGQMSVGEALKTLDNGEREIINMKLFADMTFRDIADTLKKPLGTVTWKYRNALAKLKRVVKEVQS